MYESFFGLNKKPFQITSDPDFLWMGKKHREALSTLKYGVMDNKGFLLLTGDVGTGKTTLINRLAEDIQDNAYIAKIPDPGLSKYDFFRMVCQYFNLAVDVRTKSDFLKPFSRFLHDAHQEQRSVLLLIDEAQRLKHDLMEEIRLLSNLERQDVKLINIFFVGQNEFNSILLRPENRALMRRITITYNLDPLDPAETGAYIRHRLITAGASDDIFSKAAIQAVYDFSAGYPRQINIICDLAMFFASQLKKKSVSRKIVDQSRGRVCFNVNQEPTKKRIQTRASARTIHQRPIKKRPRPLFTAVHALGAVAVLLALATGLYCTPDRWKTHVRQWVDESLRPFLPVAGAPSTTPTQVVEALTSDSAMTPATSPSVASDEPASAMASQLPLPMPQPPPKIRSLQPVDNPSTAALTATVAPSSRPPATMAPPASARPDPADAIAWLLNKRKQEVGQ